MFRTEDLEKPLSKMDLLEFLFREPPTWTDPKDLFEDTELAGENTVVTIRLPKGNTGVINWVVHELKKNGLMPHRIPTNIIMRKAHKHGLLLMLEDETIKKILQNHEKILKFQGDLLVKNGQYYDTKRVPHLWTVLNMGLDKITVVADDLQCAFTSAWGVKKISFRAYPKWLSIATKIALASGLSEYEVHRTAIIYSLSTVGTTEPSIQDLNERFGAILSVQEDVVKELNSVYEGITGQEL